MKIIHRHRTRAISLLRATLFVFALLGGHKVAAQQTNKIQQTVDAVKTSYYCEDQDYHTDGQRVVWVKSYKKWTPEDWIVIKKEAPHVIKFLNQAIQHNRYDVLEQLLPDYYRAHGGSKAFAADVMKQQDAVNANTSKENPDL